MLRALMGAGQFAHLAKEDFEPRLTELYNINTRLDWLKRQPRLANLSEAAVPLVLVKAMESRLVRRGEGFYDAKTVNFMTARLGTVCCLCMDFGDQSSADYGIPVGLMQFFCRSYLRVDEPKFQNEAPFCRPCRQSICLRIYRIAGVKPKDTPELYNEVLAWLATNKAFKERVRKFAPNEHLLRFDPRHIVYTTKNQQIVRMAA